MTSLHFNSQIESLMATYFDYLKIAHQISRTGTLLQLVLTVLSLPPVSLTPPSSRNGKLGEVSKVLSWQEKEKSTVYTSFQEKRDTGISLSSL